MTSLHSGTPTLIVTDPRALAVRNVAYCRSNIAQPADTRITRQVFNAVGHSIASWDPRLWDCAPRPNLETVHGLSGQSLLNDSADAGWQLSLQGEAQASRFNWDGRGNQRQTEYDALLRPVSITEQMDNESTLVVERFIYGAANDEWTLNNQCGRLVRHDDPAGCQHLAQYGLSGASLVEIRRFLKSLDTPDWPLEVQLRNALLEDGAGFASTCAYTPSGELHNQTDAEGNQRIFTHTVAGQLKEVQLQLQSQQQPRVLISDMRYNASGQIERETASNGVVTTVWYGADDGRPIQLLSAVPANPPLQDLHYGYDPVGNVLRFEDQAQRVRHFKNQRIDPVNQYRYDSLYQLIEARGRQVAAPSYGPALPALLPTPLDPNQLTHYTQTFDYDAAGNLLTRHHSGAPTFTMAVSDTSNRSLIQHQDGSLPDEEEIANGFDAGGNQLQLQRGQVISWDSRNQLSQVTLVKREDGSDDQEQYVYGRRGERLRKVRITHTGSRTLRADVRYLPGLEIHLDSASGEERHVINVDAGCNRVRVLHWETPPPTNASNDQLRFSVPDLLDSCTLELDHEAGVLNQEGFYAFGGTAWWAGSSKLETRCKTVRYSGKERDATGLYYYGYRYYSQWLQRWMCPDPAGDVDGLNRYQMVKNNPVTFFDADGLGLNAAEDNPNFSSTTTGSGAPHISYIKPDLKTMLDSGSKESKDRFDFVSDNMVNSDIDQYEIYSEYLDDGFSNTFLPHTWIFENNERNPDRSDYYASDVAKYQYIEVSKEKNFFGDLPSRIIRKSVTNKQTIIITRELISGTPSMLETFMRKTQNGSSTQKILNDFGLEATKVIKAGKDFIIDVKPVSGNLLQRTWINDPRDKNAWVVDASNFEPISSVCTLNTSPPLKRKKSDLATNY